MAANKPDYQYSQGKNYQLDMFYGSEKNPLMMWGVLISLK